MRTNHLVLSFLIVITILFLILYKIKQKSQIPNVIIQTYSDKSKIPNKVFANIKKFAPNYSHIVYDDEECYSFLLNEFGHETANVFKNLKKGPHKADLFRYCYLYRNGGIYLDVKTELIKPINSIFTSKSRNYTVLSKNKGQIYQGIIACASNNPILKELINYIINNSKEIKDYHVFTKDFFDKLQSHIYKRPTSGKNRDWYLFQEKCVTKKDHSGVSLCKDGFDRYGYCCFVYDGEQPIIKTRYSDFPW